MKFEAFVIRFSLAYIILETAIGVWSNCYPYAVHIHHFSMIFIYIAALTLYESASWYLFLGISWATIFVLE